MGRGTILSGGDEGLYTTRLSEAPPDAAARIKKLDEQRVAALKESDALYLRTQDLRQELSEATASLSVMLTEWSLNIIAGKDPDKPDEPEDDKAVKDWQVGLLTEHNAIRLQNGLTMLSLNGTLSASAQGHANWLASHDTTGHAGENGSTPQDRIYGAGYPRGPGGGCGENCAYGQTSVAMVMNGWMNSPHHRANILEARYQEVGFGYVYRKDGTWRHFWVANFGRMPG